MLIFEATLSFVMFYLHKSKIRVQFNENKETASVKTAISRGRKRHVCVSVPKEFASVIRNPSAKQCDWLSHARPAPFPFPIFLFPGCMSNMSIFKKNISWNCTFCSVNYECINNKYPEKWQLVNSFECLILTQIYFIKMYLHIKREIHTYINGVV